MKLNSFVNLVMLGLTLSVAGFGCHKRPTPLTKLPKGETPRTGVGDEMNTTPINTGGNANGEANPTPMGNPAEWANAARDEKVFEADTVHFEYDSSVVKSSEKSKVADVADHLKGSQNTGVEIQGHCDERGTDQYNYSLGERRALALREELIALGVDGSRIMTVSFGRSRPVDTGHSDEAHAKNRRGVFVLLSK